MSTVLLTIPQYAKQVKKVTRQAVWKAAKDKKLKGSLPRVVNITKIGRDYLLEVASA